MSIPYDPSESEIQKNWKSVKGEYNNASLALGAKVMKATDEHYSPAILVLSPFAPINMFDGMESARSRVPGHFEELTVKLAKPAAIDRIELDYSYFVNNNPLFVSVEGKSGGSWKEIIPKTHVKAFAGNVKVFLVEDKATFSEVKVRNFPCGGMNRLKVYSK